jgi:hypothetical protein
VWNTPTPRSIHLCLRLRLSRGAKIWVATEGVWNIDTAAHGGLLCLETTHGQVGQAVFICVNGLC